MGRFCVGLLTDIIKEIPHTAVLQEKVAAVEAKYAATETENAILKDDLRQANMLIAELKQQVQELTHVDDLDETEITILKKMAEVGADNFATDHAYQWFNISKAKLEYHINRLDDAGYAVHVFGDDDGAHYAPSQNGLELLVKKNLV
jgi:chromosome segregation ATPase